MRASSDGSRLLCFAISSSSEMNPSRRFAQGDGVLQRRLFFLDAGDQVAEIEIAVRVGRDRADGAGDLHELADLEIAVRRQRHNRNGADLLQREIEIGELDPVRQLHDEPVEPTQP